MLGKVYKTSFLANLTIARFPKNSYDVKNNLLFCYDLSLYVFLGVNGIYYSAISLADEALINNALQLFGGSGRGLGFLGFAGLGCKIASLWSVIQ
ncbi:Uncharacterised protein [Suttonella ornithocola]|uniref:Uncharacterized protein n=1 Tax=Suttonella ornithocola TaxID=279832 RepID=A0A380MYX7_9GAMM|nr:Uncharacterised protein [Suttonella ornithocola]